MKAIQLTAPALTAFRQTELPDPKAGRGECAGAHARRHAELRGLGHRNGQLSWHTSAAYTELSAGGKHFGKLAITH